MLSSGNWSANGNHLSVNQKGDQITKIVYWRDEQDFNYPAGICLMLLLTAYMLTILRWLRIYRLYIREIAPEKEKIVKYIKALFLFLTISESINRSKLFLERLSLSSMEHILLSNILKHFMLLMSTAETDQDQETTRNQMLLK